MATAYHLGQGAIHYEETETEAQLYLRYSIEGEATVEQVRNALAAHFVIGAYWNAAATPPMNRLRAVSYTIDERVRSDLHFGAIQFSTRTDNDVEYDFDIGAVTLVARKDRTGTALPAGEMATVHQPCMNFVITRTELAAAWGELGAGPPNDAGTQQQRVLYAMGRVNSGATFLGCTFGSWLFLGCRVRVQADGSHRVAYHLAFKSWDYGGADQILWEYVAPDGSLHEINGQCNFGTVLGLTWPSGNPILS